MKKLLSAFIILLIFGISNAAAQQENNDQIATNQGPLTVHPLHHGTLALTWNNKTIYVDPTGGDEAFSGLNAPDLILITHAHGDHLDQETLQSINTEGAVLVAPQSVADQLNQEYDSERLVLKNGEEAQKVGISIKAVPMYNLPESDDSHHPKGWGNGYVLTIAGKKIYISGDTEDITEMRSLENIDLAFVCMNLPYTMDVNQAANAVLDFKPNIVYPYHYRGQDTQKFKQLVNAGNDDIEVRLRDWYD